MDSITSRRIFGCCVIIGDDAVKTAQAITAGTECRAELRKPRLARGRIATRNGKSLNIGRQGSCVHIDTTYRAITISAGIRIGCANDEGFFGTFGCNEAYVLGGEQSGHVIFLEHNTTGDGILTAINVLNVLNATGKKLSELAQCMKSYPQVVVNAKVTPERKGTYQEDEKVKKLIEETENMFEGNGRLLIRASGTEPLIRVMIEGDDQKLIEKRAKEIAKAIEG